MNFDRREFFKQLSLVAASLAILPGKSFASGAEGTSAVLGATAVAKATGTYKVLYTFTAKNQADILEFLTLLKTSGVSSNNTKLENDGHLVYRSEFYPIAEGTMQSTLVFKSKESYDLFLESSKSVSDELIAFKKQKDIKISMQTA
ncbi:hypothetical protein DOM21_01390 [Bacteriovorax stolpii]|uniref:Uncharacterized protein n=1 Tax=Bacteriovorax stolpii TaxID=960 RepID=A0A2K9NYW0_BACTC|nr:hypothetical protein [Bacteriovorax stolpii]AUN99874.1 hypothetical protein C0V70_17540 [Bacteriovorax stolpii]QDK40133.1 hypothetical protein DOM21_01390 [Bacteriovorax stolpii]TDP54233.1 hypothetical protein C8D79_1526 [Bacteriovorax stolpii]